MACMRLAWGVQIIASQRQLQLLLLVECYGHYDFFADTKQRTFMKLSVIYQRICRESMFITLCAS